MNRVKQKKVLVIGHRGSAGLYPENTLAGFERTLDIGVDGIELDVLATADDVLCAHHFYTLKPEITRTPDRKWLDIRSTIPIKSLTFEELQSYDVGRLKPLTKYARRYPNQEAIDGERIPPFHKVIDLIKERGVDDTKLWVEIKTSPEQPDMTPPSENIVREVLKIVCDENFDLRVVLLSFNWNVLSFAKKIAPQIPTAYISATAKWLDNIKIGLPGPSPWMAGIDADDYQGSIPHCINAAGGKIWCAWSESLMKKEVQTAHDLGIKVFVWVVDSERDIRKFLKMDVDGIITNRPDRAKRILGSNL
ncbi:MAG: glycerophosphodiester phosphodiesterase family protein [Desulfobacterales bacterium]